MTTLKHPRYPEPGNTDNPVYFEGNELADAVWADDKFFAKESNEKYSDRLTFHYCKSGDCIGAVCNIEIKDGKYIFLNPKDKTGYIGRGITPELISQMYASPGDYLRIVNDSFVKKWSFYDYFVNSIIAILIIITAILLSYC